MDKEKFFAQLDRLDESTETESGSDAEALPERRSPKRRKLHIPETTLHRSNAPVAKKLSRSTASRTSGIDTASVRNINTKPKEPQEKQPVTRRHNVAKHNSGSKGFDTVNRLFDSMTFHFVPNDDVAKPRRLRIQSAIVQGAKWARTLESGVTHVIVDPDINATAIAKYIQSKGDLDVSGIAFVKMNWLIESLSHKEVRNTTDSRFQLRGTGTVLSRLFSKASPASVSGDVIALKQPMRIASRVPDIWDLNTGDELDQIVHYIKTAADLPFDEEADLDDFLAISSGDEQEQGEQHRTRNSVELNKSHAANRRSEHENAQQPNIRNAGSQCMQANPSDQAPCPNDRTISILQQIASHYDRTGDDWRTLAYRRAITALRKERARIETSAQARKIYGISKRLADKVEEIVTTDRLRRLDAVLSDPDERALQLFMGIYGVGLRKARAWIEQGHRNLDDLTKHAVLTENQKIGIEHHADFAQRIPRAEVKQHGDIVAQALKVADKSLQAIIGGSYRRCMPTSGDIDVIITHPTASMSQLQTWIFDDVIPHLTNIGFMKCALAISRPSSKSTLTSQRTKSTSDSATVVSIDNTPTNTGSKFLGASALTPTSPWRRIDLLLVSPASIGAALIYFTGNDIFNRSLRLLASKKGMHLNQHGLYKDVMRGKGGVKLTEGEFVEGRSEERIFELLGVPWRSVEERNC